MRLAAVVAGALAFSAAPAEAKLAGQFLFQADDGSRGSEVWKTDGTKRGTKFLKNINRGDDDGFAGPDGSFPSEFTRFDGRFFFAASGQRGRELWRTDGTKRGTKLVKDINPGDDEIPAGPDSSSPLGLTKFGGHLYFGADDGVSGAELWRTDGTRRGTKRFKQIFPGAVGSFPGEFFKRGGRLLFRANDGPHGAELWKSDGTRAGTKLLKDINAGNGSSLPSGYAAIGKRVYFAAEDAVNGRELWRTNGKGPGTKLVKNINPGAADSFPFWFAGLGRKVYFAANDGTHGNELWRTNGKAQGTKLLKDINPGDDEPPPGADSSGPFRLTRVGDWIYFSANDGLRGRELWRTNGSGSRTRLFKDIRTGDDSSFPCQLAKFGGTLLFGALTPNLGYEPWKSDGKRRGTKRLKDIVPGPESSFPFGCD